MAKAVSKILVGAIRNIKHVEGFGFITAAETGQDHFFHRTMLRNPEDWMALQQGQRVEFMPAEGPKGLRAVDVVGLQA